ncbi:hypothetical protein HK101_010218 [Irineochytrium annulatum]|nr:hypothetical protein HK101_010218 [Irineochytrium annulatum]
MRYNLDTTANHRKSVTVSGVPFALRRYTPVFHQSLIAVADLPTDTHTLKMDNGTTYNLHRSTGDLLATPLPLHEGHLRPGSVYPLQRSILDVNFRRVRCMTVTGSTGFIGGTILTQLIARRAAIGKNPGAALPQGEAYWLIQTILRRKTAEVDAERERMLREQGVDVVTFTDGLDDDAGLVRALAYTDVCIHAAEGSDHVAGAKSILRGLEKAKMESGCLGWMIHTSGVGVIMDDAKGADVKARVWDDAGEPPLDSLFEADAPHRDVDLVVSRAMRTMDIGGVVIVIPPLVTGRGTGLFKKVSNQLPTLISIAANRRVAGYQGEGASIWSWVHVSDLAAFYVHHLLDRVLMDDAPRGENGYLFAEAGDKSWKEMAEHIKESMRLRGLHEDWGPTSFTEEELKAFGMHPRYFSSNARCRGSIARRWGWAPQHLDFGACVESDVEYICRK